MTCSHIRTLIDDSDHPETLPADVLRHTAGCAECSRFARARAELRELLGSAGRVSAPPNFDAVLSARLAEVTAKNSRSWFTPALYLRLGAATALVLIIIVATQYVRTGHAPGPNLQDGRVDPTMTARIEAPHNPALEPPKTPDAAVSRTPPGGRSHRTVLAIHNLSESADSAPVLWFRSPDIEVGVPAISVGAQLPYYATAGQAGVRTVRTSF